MNKCSIVKDLLPLYIENMLQEDSKKFVEEHLADCPDCQKELKAMQQSAKVVVDADVVPLKKLRKKMLEDKIQTILFTMALVFVIAIAAFAVLNSPRFFPYDANLMQITENENGKLLISFDERVKAYGYTKYYDEQSDVEVYDISAWDSLWEHYFSTKGQQNMSLEVKSSDKVRIFYNQNNGDSDVLIYGLEMDGGVVSLPRLALSYYFTFALLCLLMFWLMRLFIRKHEDVKRALDRIWPLPLAYILAHFCVKGFEFRTYTLQRDFGYIMLITVAIYIAFLIGVDKYYKKKLSRSL